MSGSFLPVPVAKQLIILRYLCAFGNLYEGRLINKLGNSAMY